MLLSQPLGFDDIYIIKKGGISKLIEEEHRIDFIILRKFPLYKVVKYGEKQPPGSVPNRVVDRDLRKEILGYEKEILSLDRPSFAASHGKRSEGW